ncbi:MAG TPA: response regulator transcription factor [Solirubrobacteraceae bacterium]|nr:response regulator transcription factor [Solirubrobacteraceae bacterium]
MANDFPMLLEQIQQEIAKWKGFDLVDSEDELVPSLGRLKPDIALVGPFREAGPHEGEILAAAQGEVRVVFMSADQKPPIYDAVALGASGYLTMEAGAQELRSVLDAVAANGVGFSAAAQQLLAAEIRVRGRAERPSVTKREQEILLLMGKGLSSTQIGKELDISSSTVKTHSHNLLKKFGVNSRAQAVLTALRYKLI